MTDSSKQAVLKERAAADTEYMKVFFQCAAAFFVCSLLAAQDFAPQEEVPELLRGLWQNESRIVSFGASPSSSSVVLKLFYGWYYDRAAEPDPDAPARPRNAAVSGTAEEILVSFEPLLPATDVSGAWNLKIRYPAFNETVFVPVAVFGGKLYTDFMLVSGTETVGQRVLQASSNVAEITVGLPVISENVHSVYDSGDGLFRIRYWRTDMDYDAEGLAEFSDGGRSYSVAKHLVIGGTVYTCVAGRGKQIRNPEKLSGGTDGYEFSPDGRLCAANGEYMSLLDEDASTLHGVVNAANSRRRPPRPPLLPYPDVDFHYDDVRRLRKHAVVPLP